MEAEARKMAAAERLSRILSWAASEDGSNLRTHLDEWAAFEVGGELLTRGGRQRWLNNPCPIAEGARLLEYMDRHSVAAKKICKRGVQKDKAVKKPKRGDPAPFRIIVDHTIPVRVLGAEIRRNTDLHSYAALSEFLRKTYRRTVLTWAENKVLDSQFRSSMPPGWEFGDDPYARYMAVGIELAEELPTDNSTPARGQ